MSPSVRNEIKQTRTFQTVHQVEQSNQVQTNQTKSIERKLSGALLALVLGRGVCRRRLTLRHFTLVPDHNLTSTVK
jgi:plastocyanin domain-containing protein